MYAQIYISTSELHTLTYKGTSQASGWGYISQHGRMALLIDTPGFDTLAKPDMEVLRSITRYIQDMKCYVISVIYLHRVTERRITGSIKLNLRLLRALCGEHYFQNTVLVTTMWSTVPVSSMEATCVREVELNTSSSFWADMIERGAKYARWEGSSERAKEIVELCLLKADAPKLNIIMELQRGFPLEETSAGRILTEELRRREEEEREVLRGEQEAMRSLERQRADLEARVRYQQDEVRRERELADISRDDYEYEYEADHRRPSRRHSTGDEAEFERPRGVRRRPGRRPGLFGTDWSLVRFRQG